MLLQVLVTSLVAAGLAPCVVQSACRTRPQAPPSAVCMHRLDACAHRKSTKSMKNDN